MDLLPLRLLDPFWQLACTAALTGNGFLALLAVLLINLAAVLDPEAEWLLGLAVWRALDWAGAAESRGASQGLQRIARFRQAAIQADLLGQLRVAEQQARAGGPWDLPPPPSARAASSRCVRNGGRRWKGCWRRA